MPLSYLLEAWLDHLVFNYAIYLQHHAVCSMSASVLGPLHGCLSPRVGCLQHYVHDIMFGRLTLPGLQAT